MKLFLAQSLLIRGAKQLLTLRGPSGVRRGAALNDLAIIEDGSVLIRDGMIAQVGSTRRVENLKEARGAAEIAVNGAVVMPGFVDSGIYLGYGPASDSGKGTRTAEFYNDSLMLLRSCLQYGTLNAQVKVSAQSYDSHSDLALLRQLGRIGDQPIGVTRTWRIHIPSRPTPRLSDDYAATVSLLAKRKLAHCIEIPLAYASRDENILGAAQANSLGIHLAWSGGGGTMLAGLLHRLRPRSLNCPTNLTSDECRIIGRFSAPVVFSPGRSIGEDRLSDAPRQLVDFGVPICLSSGYSSDMPVFNLQIAITLAVLRLRLRAEEAIAAATINAAYAAGLGHVLGSLEAGKRADLLVMNVPDYREIPRRFGTNHVGMAIREGKVVFNRNGWRMSAA